MPTHVDSSGIPLSCGEGLMGPAHTTDEMVQFAPEVVSLVVVLRNIVSLLLLGVDLNDVLMTSCRMFSELESDSLVGRRLRDVLHGVLDLLVRLAGLKVPTPTVRQAGFFKRVRSTNGFPLMVTRVPHCPLYFRLPHYDSILCAPLVLCALFNLGRIPSSNDIKLGRILCPKLLPGGFLTLSLSTPLPVHALHQIGSRAPTTIQRVTRAKTDKT